MKTHGSKKQGDVGTTDDSISVNRTVEVVEAGAIPAVPARFRATDLRSRQRRLRTISSNHQAEARDALAELVARGDGIQADLGPNAPTATEAAALLPRLDAIRTSLDRAQKLLAYLMEIEDIALSDTAVILDRAFALYEVNVAINSTLAASYPRLARYASLHGKDVAEGIARSRGAGEPPPPPAPDDGDGKPAA